MKVSVRITTHNHEKYISKALDRVLYQKVNFNYNIVIGEDFSTDNTRKILNEYKNKYPDKIILLLNKENIGMIRNNIQTISACTGEYIAMLDGDDFWTSPDKIQKQIDFMDSHKNCAICFHAAKIIYSKGIQPVTGTLRNPCARHIYGINDLLTYGNFIPTSSVIYRRKNLKFLPDWFKEAPIGDWPIHFINAQHGEIAYIDEIMSAYRVHHDGVWNRTDSVDRAEGGLKIIKLVGKHLKLNKNPVFKKSLSKHLLLLARRYETNGNFSKACNAALKSAFYNPSENMTVGLKMALRLKLQRFAKLFKSILGPN